MIQCERQPKKTISKLTTFRQTERSESGEQIS